MLYGRGWSSPACCNPSLIRHPEPEAKDPLSRKVGRSFSWVQIDLGKHDNDHFIDPEERLRIAMARQ